VISRPIHVLLVEDNPGDVELTRESFAAGRLHLELSVAEDGEQALQFLRRRGRFATAERPDLILLDLNLPRRDGRQVLAEIKGDADLKLIPVVVLTSSEAETDVVKSYDLGANCYVSKPLDLQAFQRIVRAVEGFWFTIVKLPPGRGGSP
jgi:two-component system, chemotaxis family, response regulator Rcp1